MATVAESLKGATQNAQPSKDSSTVVPPDGAAKSLPKKPRAKRPNYNEIHAKPLPLEVYPLPAFIPHNPLSIVRIVVALLSQSLWRPNSHSVVHQASYSQHSQSVHITHPRSIRALWEQGFWGSGSLSRSEPRWLDQAKRKRGLEAQATSEEFTRGRREERRQFKLERAKAQREAIEQQLRDEGKLDAVTNVEELLEDGFVTESPKGTLYSTDDAVPLGALTAEGSSLGQELKQMFAQEEELSPLDEDQEHLQLTFQEAFYLSYVLGILDIYQGDVLPNSSSLLRLFCANSDSFVDTPLPTIAPDNPFLLNYVVFHHFRSLGWVVRPGMKFACDYLLYLRGPAFHHAEFAILVIPAYSHSHWRETPERAATCKKKQNRDWWWLHRLNRVQTQVHKTLMLAYVEVPPPWDGKGGEPDAQPDIGATLQKYQVREFVWKRWSPNRNRD